MIHNVDYNVDPHVGNKRLCVFPMVISPAIRMGQYRVNGRISALIVFARFWRILRVINGVIVGTKQDGDTRVRHLKKKIAIMKNQEFDNGSLKVSLDEVMEENVRLNLLQERLEEDDGRQGSKHQS